MLKVNENQQAELADPSPPDMTAVTGIPVNQRETHLLHGVCQLSSFCRLTPNSAMDKSLWSLWTLPSSAIEL